MTPHQFIAKWKVASDLTERAGYQNHFNDLCKLLGEQSPTDADPSGRWFTFEKGVEKIAGGKGFADVWRRGFFGWEYKGKHKDLKAAYNQLLQYREALLNPPLLIVCDLSRFEVHTNFPNTPKQVHAFDLDGIADPKNLAKLRAAFTNPDELKPGVTQRQVTEEAAGRFARLADGLRGRGVPADAAGHFLMKLMFCMFAEDIELLPRTLFARTVANSKNDPAKLSKFLRTLFGCMAKGDPYGADDILRFNGGLFADADVIDLTPAEIAELSAAAECDWSAVEPSIFGTLFERILDPGKRSQLGAHYTSRDDILTLLEPVMMAPLRREWEAVRAKADKLWEKAKGAKAGTKDRRAFEKCVNDFLYRLAHVTVLDPACGSGNFLYVAINLLLDLEKEVLTYAAGRGLNLFPFVRPTQLRGIELNPYAQQLAQVVIWIGFLQWMRFNGFVAPTDPVLDPMETIQNRDAILDLSDPANPKEPDWPDAEFIVGNPPFLGGKMLRSNLGDGYVDDLFRVWGKRLPNFSDLCCYWFEKAREMIQLGRTKRAGLLGTQAIRGGASRETLMRIKESGDIFFAVSDSNWLLDGANVHISMVGFDNGNESDRLLNGVRVDSIHANLTSTADITTARQLTASQGRSFIGVQKSGPFDVPFDIAVQLLNSPSLGGRLNSDVIRIYRTAEDMVRRTDESWIAFFQTADQDAASLYEAPFEYLRRVVPPERTAKHFAGYPFWITWRPRGELYAAIRGLNRFIITPHVSKHRLFAWAEPYVCPSNLLIAVAADDDFTFGVLHSRFHELWARSQGTQLREAESGFRYTPTTCFETFPFPDPTPAERAAVAAAAKELDALRSNWLNPPEWTRTDTLTFPGSADGPWKRYVRDPDARGVGTVAYPRTVPKDAASAALLKKRTLTNLYNERPAWLVNAHRKLDEAVAAAYGWPADLPDDALLAKLLELNLSRAGSEPAPGKK